MSVPLNVVQAARRVFAEGFEREAQQTMSRFRSYADVKTGLTGKTHGFKKIVKREMVDVTGRLQDTNPEEQLFRYRYLFPRKAKLATIFDEDDASELALAVAPTGETIVEHTSAAARKIDAIFIAGILGANFEGEEDNMTSVPLPASQQVAINYHRDGSTTNVGLTLAKLIAGKAKFGKNEVHGQGMDGAKGKLCMAVSQDELDNLLFDVEQTGSADYNKVRALVDGEVDYFMGIHFLRSELLPTASLGGGKISRTCPMWVSDQVRLGFWADLKTSIDVLPNKDQAIQIYSRIRLNSCRKDENAVVAVFCQQDG